MANDSKVSYPSMPISHWWALRNQLQKSIPGSITPNYVASTLDMTEDSARKNILPSLKVIGLIDDSGKVNAEKARMFRDDEQYKKFCDGVLKAVYPQELLDTFHDENSDQSKVKRWFMNSTGVGDNGAGKFASLFMTLREANPTKETKAKSNTNSTGATKERKPTAIKKEIKLPEEPIVNLDRKGRSVPPEIHVNVQVHIAPDMSNEQIEKIFENMGKHLFGK